MTPLPEPHPVFAEQSNRDGPRPPFPPFGVDVQRALKAEEVELVEALWAHFQPKSMLKDLAVPECCWLNLFQQGRWLHTFGDRQPEVEALAKAIALEMCPYYEKLHCTSISLFMSPQGCEPQFWHVDYTGTETNIALTLTPWVKENGMEFMKGEISDVDFQAFRRGLVKDGEPGDGVPELRSNSGLLKYAADRGFKNLSLNQCLCDKHMLVRMAPGTIHRGIPNTSGYHRCYMLLVMDEQPMILNDEGNEANKLELSSFIKTYGGSYGIPYEPISASS